MPIGYWSNHKVYIWVSIMGMQVSASLRWSTEIHLMMIDQLTILCIGCGNEIPIHHNDATFPDPLYSILHLCRPCLCRWCEIPVAFQWQIILAFGIFIMCFFHNLEEWLSWRIHRNGYGNSIMFDLFLWILNGFRLTNPCYFSPWPILKLPFGSLMNLF